MPVESVGRSELLRLAESVERSQILVCRGWLALCPTLDSWQIRKMSRWGGGARASSASLCYQPRFSFGVTPKHVDRFEISSGQHFEHPHHAEHSIARGYNGAGSELNLRSYCSQLCRDCSELGGRWQGVRLADVQQHIQMPCAGWIVFKGAKVLQHFGKCQRSVAGRTDDFRRFVDAVGHGHGVAPLGKGYHARSRNVRIRGGIASASLLRLNRDSFELRDDRAPALNISSLRVSSLESCA